MSKKILLVVGSVLVFIVGWVCADALRFLVQPVENNKPGIVKVQLPIPVIIRGGNTQFWLAGVEDLNCTNNAPVIFDSSYPFVINDEKGILLFAGEKVGDNMYLARLKAGKYKVSYTPTSTTFWTRLIVENGDECYIDILAR
jgi:hypothetical protein